MGVVCECPPHLVSFDVDGYGPHYSKLDRKGFSDERDRQNLLVMDNWKVFRFSVDKLKDHKRACQGQLLQIIGCLYGEDSSNLLTPQEQLIIQKAGIYGDQFTPGQAAEWLGLSDRQARKYLQRLMEKNQIVPASGVEQIRTYKLSYDERIKGVDRK